MLIKNVPQDDANLFEGKGSELCYAVDENGNYIKAHSIGWDAKNTVINQAWDVVNEKITEAKMKCLEGKISPISFHMEKNLMDLSLLAKYVGISKWRVKRHLRVEAFKKLNRELLGKYAKVFDISIEQLSKVD